MVVTLEALSLHLHRMASYWKEGGGDDFDGDSTSACVFAPGLIPAHLGSLHFAFLGSVLASLGFKMPLNMN